MSFEGTVRLSNQRVNHGRTPILDNLVAGTVFLWVWVDDMNEFQMLAAKRGGNWSAGYTGWTIWTDFNSQDTQFTLIRSGSNLQITGSGNRLSSNKWQFVAAVWNRAGSNNDQKLFYGDLDTLAAEYTYSQQNVGSGAPASDASEDVWTFNAAADGAGGGLDGKIAVVGLFSEPLSLGQIQSLQYRPYPLGKNCELLSFYGLHGIGPNLAVDMSGNGLHGTPLNLNLAKYIPLGPPFGFDSHGPYSVAAAPVTQTIDTDLRGHLFSLGEIDTNLSGYLQSTAEVISNLRGHLNTIDNEVQTLLSATLEAQYANATLLSGYLEKLEQIQTTLSGYIELFGTANTTLSAILQVSDIEEVTNLTGWISFQQTINILTDLTGYLFQVNEAVTNLRGYFNTIDNLRTTDLTGYLDQFVEITTNLRGHLNAIDLTTDPAFLRGYLQLSDIEISTLLSAYLYDAIEVQSNLSGYLAGILGESTDLTAYFSKLGLQLFTALSGFLVEADKFPHVCFTSGPREGFVSSGREGFASGPDSCPSKRII